MTKEEFGLKIKEIRLSVGMSQIKFANLLGWKDSQSIAGIESGKTPFPADKVYALNKVFPNISIEDVIEDLAAVQKEKIREKVYSSIPEKRK